MFGTIFFGPFSASHRLMQIGRDSFHNMFSQWMVFMNDAAKRLTTLGATLSFFIACEGPLHEATVLEAYWVQPNCQSLLMAIFNIPNQPKATATQVLLCHHVRS